MSKSYVTIETSLCPVCGKQTDTGAVLLATDLKDRFDMKTPTHWDLCMEHKKKFEEGFVALVEATNKVPVHVHSPNLMPGDAARTGNICHVKFEVAELLFGSKVEIPMVFVEPGVIEKVGVRFAELLKAQQDRDAGVVGKVPVSKIGRRKKDEER